MLRLEPKRFGVRGWELYDDAHHVASIYCGTLAEVELVKNTIEAGLLALAKPDRPPKQRKPRRPPVRPP